MAELKFVLEGKVSIVEIKDDGTIETSDIPGELVLKCLVQSLEKGLDLLEDKRDNAVE